MKILGIGSVLRSEGNVRYFVESINKNFIRLRSDLGGFVEFTLGGFEDMLAINVFMVEQV